MITATTLANAARAAYRDDDQIGHLHFARETSETCPVCALIGLVLAYEREQEAQFVEATRLWSDRHRQFVDVDGATARLLAAVSDANVNPEIEESGR